MERFLLKDLLKWKENTQRKPLILNGARQVGKTWLLKKFGQTYYKNVAYINFDSNGAMKSQFEADYNIERIINAIQFYTNENISPKDTLIIFDEIQECSKALTSLKYFCEHKTKYHITAAGSLLGITIHEGTGYPVGKVQTLNLYPLSLGEFLIANNKHNLYNAIKNKDVNIINSFSSDFVDQLKTYYYVGGMPEVVKDYISTGTILNTREIQNQIIKGYKKDISKHLSYKETEKAIEAFNSIPAHLSQENKKFIFGHIATSARAIHYKAGLTWLSEAGIVNYVYRISKPGVPLSAYTDTKSFKLFLLDTGLLCAMCKLDNKTILEGNSIFQEFKGALTEQYVCQELLSECQLDPYYWSAKNSSGEIDFVIQNNQDVYSIEVKSEENLQSKSLRAFHAKYPNTKAVRFSLSGYREQDWMKNVPLYCVGNKDFWM